MTLDPISRYNNFYLFSFTLEFLSFNHSDRFSIGIRLKTCILFGTALFRFARKARRVKPTSIGHVI